MTHVYMDAFGLSDNVEYESKYDFDAYIQMDITRFDKKGKVENQSVYDSYVNRESVDYAMEFMDNQSRTIVIYDFAESVMLMLSESDGEKTGFAMGFDQEAMTERIESAAEDAESEHPFDLRKTGKTKMILGYTCEEYFGDDETAEVRMWVSEKLAKEVRREMLYNQQYFGGTFHHAAYVNGMVMEYNYLDKEEGERVVMQVTDIDLNRPHSISTREYAVLTMQQSEEEEE
jgi:hypothetical protein